MPHLMNCSHQGKGWCLICVNELQLRAERAEATIKCELPCGSPEMPSCLCEAKQLRIEELQSKLSAAEQQIAGMREAVAYWREYYEEELGRCDESIKQAMKQEDNYAVNFQQGKRSGLINHDIALTRIKNFFTTPTNQDWVRREKVKDMLSGFQCSCFSVLGVKSHCLKCTLAKELGLDV